MVFYKKFTSRHSFKGCNYTNTNKYIYLTLVNENSNLNNRDNNVICHAVDEMSNNDYIPEFSSNDAINQKLFYDLDENEQII